MKISKNCTFLCKHCLSPTLLPASQLVTTNTLLSVTVVLLFIEYHVNEIISHVVFFAWLSHSVKYFKDSSVMLEVSVEFFLLPCIFHYMNILQFVYPFTNTKHFIFLIKCIRVTLVSDIVCFSCTVLQHVVCALHCAFTTQSQISFYHCIFDSLYPLPPPPTPFCLVTVILSSVSAGLFLIFSCLSKAAGNIQIQACVITFSFVLGKFKE